MPQTQELARVEHNWQLARPGQQIALRFTPDQVELIKNTVAQGATDDELALFLYTCERRGLDPVLKQIHFVKRQQSYQENGQWKSRSVAQIQTGIDGFRLIADRRGNYLPGRLPEFEIDDKGNLLWATAFVRKWSDKDKQWHEIAGRVSFKEFAAKDRNGNAIAQWKPTEKPFHMLAKCAEALAFRLGWPEDMSGLLVAEETQGGATYDAQPEPPAPEPPTAKQRMPVRRLPPPDTALDAADLVAEGEVVNEQTGEITQTAAEAVTQDPGPRAQDLGAAVRAKAETAAANTDAEGEALFEQQPPESDDAGKYMKAFARAAQRKNLEAGKESAADRLAAVNAWLTANKFQPVQRLQEVNGGQLTLMAKAIESGELSW